MVRVQTGDVKWMGEGYALDIVTHTKGTNSNGHPRKVAVSCYPLSEPMPLVCAHIPSGYLPAGAARLPTWFAGLGFVDREGTAFELFAVEPLNGGFGGCTIGHLDKPKAFGAARVTVGNHIDLVHNSILLKELAEVMIRRIKRKVPYKDIHAKSSAW